MEKPLNPHYTRYHPRWHRRRIPIFWWLSDAAYIRFIARELTSLFVGYGAALLLVQLWFLGRGAEAYDRFLAVLAHPAAIAFHGVVLVAVTFHAVTWLGLAPKVLVVRLGGRRVPEGLVLAGHYAALLVVSGILAWVLLRR